MSIDFSNKHARLETPASGSTGVTLATDPEKAGYEVKEHDRPSKRKVLAIALLTAAGMLYLQTRCWPLKSALGRAELYLPPPSMPKLPAYSLDSNIANSLGPYSARYAVPSDISPDLPPGCDVKMINILQRHGARYPTKGAWNGKEAEVGKEAQKGIKQTLEQLKAVRVEDIRKPFEFLHDFEFSVNDTQADELVEFGRLQSYRSGQIIASKYPRLSKSTFVSAWNNKTRVVQSAQWWRQGFNKGPFPVDVSELPPLNVERLDKKDKDEDYEPLGWLEVFAPPITTRLNEFLPRANLNNQDTLNLMDLCGYHTAAENGLASPWCNVFTPEEWKSYEYYYDLEKYYSFSYGSSSKTIEKGIEWVDKLLGRLKSPEAQIYADFYSDNNIMRIIAAMGILQDKPSLSKKGPIPSLQQMVVSKVVPFAGCMIVEKVTCSTSGPEDYVRILINDAVVSQTSCGNQHGMCALDMFLKNQPVAKKTSHRVSE